MSETAPSNRPADSDPPAAAAGEFDMDQLPTSSYTEKTTKQENSLSERGFKLALIVGAILLGFGAMFFFNTVDKEMDSDRVRSGAIEVMMVSLAGQADFQQIRQLVEKHHPRCFEESYRAGGRRTAAQFDEEKYLTLLTAAIEADLAQQVDSQSLPR